MLLDLGANVECSADNLVQFAVMGEVYARKVLGLAKPSVGLLNVGEEDLKGNDAVKKAAAILQRRQPRDPLPRLRRGRRHRAGTVDVVVTDGFTGNIALKTAEGTARLYSHFLKRALTSSPLARFGALLAGPALRKMRARCRSAPLQRRDVPRPQRHCVKSHGGTDARRLSPTRSASPSS